MDEVQFDEALIMGFAEFFHDEGLADLTSACDHQRFVRPVFVKRFDSFVNLSLEHCCPSNHNRNNSIAQIRRKINRGSHFSIHFSF